MTVNSGDVSPSSSHSESNGHRNSRTRRKSISPRLKTDRPHASHHVERSKVYKSPLSDEDDENRHRTGREWDEARRRSRSPKHLSERPERSRHDDRARIGKMGVRSVWAHSPSMRDIHDIYAEMEEEQKKIDEDIGPKAVKKRHRSSSSSSGSSVKKKSKKEKKHSKKDKKHKKKKLRDSKKSKKKKEVRSSDESEEEWVELTEEMREAEAAKEKQEEALMMGPPVPDYLVEKQMAIVDRSKHVNYGKDMLRGEAAAMAAYIAQGKRIPRRGEIGLSSAEISEFEKIGYVMSGTRHKSMEATRLRKENQVMTAEEKRLLSGFTHDERKKKEEIVLQQFRSFIDSKKAKSSQ